MSRIRKCTGALSRVIAARLAPGCDLVESIETIAKEENITNGIILSGAASLRKAVLRNVGSFPEKFPITDDVRIFLTRTDPMELLALSGNISTRDGQFHLHCHVVVSSGEEDGRAYGGHLMKGTEIFSTGEVVIAEITGCEMIRLEDQETKAAELHFR
ncbi:MAG: PPC domain-containing DNA-binding protein [Thermovirgaceae bacterium]